jgi:hypothetical protein
MFTTTKTGKSLRSEFQLGRNSKLYKIIKLFVCLFVFEAWCSFVLILWNISFCDKRREVILKVIITGVWSTSGLILRPILLLSSVCVLLLVSNCVNLSENCDKSGQENGVVYKGVSSIYRPKRHESGSYVHFSNSNSNSIQITGCIFKFSRGQSHKRNGVIKGCFFNKCLIVDISATVGLSSILSLICDHDVFCVLTDSDHFDAIYNKELVAANILLDGKICPIGNCRSIFIEDKTVHIYKYLFNFSSFSSFCDHDHDHVSQGLSCGHTQCITNYGNKQAHWY